MYHFGFIMQQVLGHITAYRNFRDVVERDASVAPTWTEVTFEEPGGWVERLPVAPAEVKGAIRGILQVQRGLRKKSYDAVLFNSQTLCRFVRGSMRRVPSVIVTDVTPYQYDQMGDFYEHLQPPSSALARYKHRTYVDVYRSAHLIVPWSHWTKGSLIHDYGVSEEKIVVIPPGVDVQHWTAPPAEARQAQREQAERLPSILFVGGDFDRKGGPLLLDWFLQRGQGHCDLHIVTRTPPKIAEAIPGLHLYTNLAPNSPELMQLYAQSHLFVLPTRADCFGIALVEAMAMGLPVVATDVGGVPDIVEDGKQGFLIQPQDGVALTDRLARLLADEPLRCAMGDAARARVLTHFDAARNSTRLIELMKALTPAKGNS
jgi:glycosyltransferase involved in cell wall biosynthesis